MWGRRILYLLALFVSLVFYGFYREWFSWLALIGILFLPAAALLLSLPAMAGLRLRQSGPREVEAGTPLELTYEARCNLPHPPYRCDTEVRQVTSGICRKVKEGKLLPTEHCGMLVCRPKRPVAHDYLGLFGLRIRGMAPIEVLVLPQKQRIPNLPGLERYRSKQWKPKPGGGFAENHEMRLYRPGDKLNQIHWKMSTKTGKLMVREPMEPIRERVLAEMILRGTPEELDRNCGQLLWLSEHLLEKEIPHEMRVLTGNGLLQLPVTDEESLRLAMRTLLSQPPAPAEAVLETVQAGWVYRIGGGTE
jgi:uncharacterized protein (DUF58 family)